MWNQEEAIALCRRVEPIVARFGCHVALTGGVLYKDGLRKDCDLIVYHEGRGGDVDNPVAFSDVVDRAAMMAALSEIDITVLKDNTRVVKAALGMKDMRIQHIDFIFPECDGEYVPGDEAKDQVALDLLQPADAPL